MTEDLVLECFSNEDYRFDFSVANGYKALPRPASSYVVAGISRGLGRASVVT